MRYGIKQIFLLLMTGLFSACTVSPEDIRLNAVNGVKLDGVTLSQARLTLGVTLANDSYARVALRAGILSVGDSKGRIAEIELGREIALPRRSSGSIEIPLILRFNAPLGSILALPRLSADPENLKINGEIRLRSGCLTRKLTIEETSLHDFLKMLGVSDLESIRL
jgi:hypothetical protein